MNAYLNRWARNMSWLILIALAGIFLFGFVKKAYGQEFEFEKPYKSLETFCFNRDDAVSLLEFSVKEKEAEAVELVKKGTCYRLEISAVYFNKVYEVKGKDESFGYVYYGIVYNPKTGMPVSEIWLITDEVGKPKGVGI